MEETDEGAGRQLRRERPKGGPWMFMAGVWTTGLRKSSWDRVVRLSFPLSTLGWCRCSFSCIHHHPFCSGEHLPRVWPGRPGIIASAWTTFYRDGASTRWVWRYSPFSYCVDFAKIKGIYVCTAGNDGIVTCFRILRVPDSP